MYSLVNGTASDPSPSPTRWLGIKSILEQEFLYAGTHDEIEKLFCGTKRFVPAGPHHRLPELNWRLPSGRGFINDADLPAVDRIHAVDDTHVGNPGVKQIHDILSMLGVEKVVTAFIIELCERLGRDFSQRGRSRITEGHASRSIGQHITKGDRC